MECCCGPAGYEEEFGAAYAGRLARQYRRRGLDRTAQRMVDWIADQARVTEVEKSFDDIMKSDQKAG